MLIKFRSKFQAIADKTAKKILDETRQSDMHNNFLIHLHNAKLKLSCGRGYWVEDFKSFRIKKG